MILQTLSKVKRIVFSRLKTVLLSLLRVFERRRNLEEERNRKKLKRELDRLISENEYYKKFFKFKPPGHYYSPLFNVDDILKNENRIWGKLPHEIPGINLNLKHQLNVLEHLRAYYKDVPFNKEGSRRYEI